MSFSQFMRQGGFGMVPLLIFGVVCLGAGLWFAVRPARRPLAFTGVMWLLVLTSMLHTMLINVSVVFRAMEDARQVPMDHLPRVLFAGLKESSRPGALGGIFLSLTLLSVAVGVFRRRFWEPNPAPAPPPAPAPTPTPAQAPAPAPVPKPTA
jgi:hypothetical protein